MNDTEKPNQSEETEQNPSLEQRINELEEIIANNKDLMLRTMADAENTKRRVERDLEQVKKYALEKIARDILPVLDTFQRSEQSLDKTEINDPKIKAFIEAMHIAGKTLFKVLNQHGLNLLNPEGQIFDPNQHQAFFEKNHDSIEKGHIAEVMQPGYILHDRVIRPAFVGVSKGPAETENLENSESNPK